MSEPTRTHPPDPNNVTRTRAADASGSDDAGEIAAPPGYELIGEIGRGGMGIVFRARDLDLSRDVAVKVLLPQYAPDSATARRFLDEAGITGRLQHPGIPAVYRVGTCADGRPFLAMKLIGGQTLEELLKEQPTASDPSLTPFEQAAHRMLDRLDAVLRRGRFLTVFEQVTQAVGYAHQQGVIHRDLKPANIMVGAFGEVQVMDWGIARSGDRRPQPDGGERSDPAATVDHAPHSDFRTPHSDLTQAGAILGTPAFMPPEQAIGAVDQIGKPSDVFGLGAILCVILTGKPPYVGGDSESNRQLAARAKLDDAFTRLDTCGAEPELVALAKRCLAAEPAERPRDAGEVASAVADLRAAAEERAKEAELDRAKAEVKSAEERKRRRVQYALATAILVLVAVAGVAAWWVDSLRGARRRVQEAVELKRQADLKEREAELKARQLATERDVLAALNEVQVLREEGWKQADDTHRWGLTLTAARSALKRAEGLLAAGEPTDALRNRVAGAEHDLALDARDRALLVELDRVADSNEIRLFFPVSLTSVVSRQFASAFKSHGIDLTTVSTAEVIAWLRQHRFRDRLVIAIRSWRFSLPFSETGVPASRSVGAIAAVGGGAGAAAMRLHPNRATKLDAILKAVTDEPFSREWWDAVERKDVATLKQMLGRPEMARLSSRELSSLADGLDPFSDTNEVLLDFLKTAHDRFPGEFWVHFRLALVAEFAQGSKDESKESKEKKAAETIRHLTAAVAARPKSAVARAALGMELLEKKRDDAAGGLRLLRGASEVDPTSPWPHLFLGMFAVENEDWPEAFRAFKEAARADADTAYFLVSATAMFFLAQQSRDAKSPLSDREITQFIDELIAIRPDHPGGYDLRGSYFYQKGDHRTALAAYRKAKSLHTPDYPGALVSEGQLAELEAEARWEQRLPAVLRGEDKPANGDEFAELASYCATFEQKYALAVRFAEDGLKADPKLAENWIHVVRFAGWAVQAGVGNGVDDAELTPVRRAELRRQALAWLRDATKDAMPERAALGSFYLWSNPDLSPARDPKELAKLPPEERAEWEKFWAEFPPLGPKSNAPEVAPPPRPVK